MPMSEALFKGCRCQRLLQRYFCSPKSERMWLLSAIAPRISPMLSLPLLSPSIASNAISYLPLPKKSSLLHRNTVFYFGPSHPNILYIMILYFDCIRRTEAIGKNCVHWVMGDLGTLVFFYEAFSPNTSPCHSLKSCTHSAACCLTCEQRNFENSAQVMSRSNSVRIDASSQSCSSSTWPPNIRQQLAGAQITLSPLRYPTQPI